MSQLLIGLRVLRRQGLYGLMAVLGLAIGLAVAVIALLFTWQETHYDSHIENADRIFIVDSRVTRPGRTEAISAQTPGALAAALDDRVPGLEMKARVLRQWSTLAIDDRFNFNLEILGVQDAWLEMIGLPIVAGSRNSFTSDATAALLSQTLATRLFGDEPPVGKSFLLDGTATAVVGVYQDFPTTSHMVIDLIVPERAPAIAGRGVDFDGDWARFTSFTYVQLKEGTSVSAAEQAIEDIVHQNFQTARWLPTGGNVADLIDNSLQSLSGLHLNDRTYDWGVRPPADKLKLTVFAAIAVLIVVIACVNHINLSTVRSIERAREVALRKILGAGRHQLVVQFLLEATVLACVALVLALTLVELSSDFANDLLQTQLDLTNLTEPSFLLWLLGLVAFVVLAAGVYPAYIVSAVMPGKILASHARGARGSKGLRSVLVVFQFAVSICLAIGAAVIWSQLKYARQADLGFNAENVMLLYGVGRAPESAIRLTDRLDKSISGRPGILAVSASNSSPSWGFVPEVDVRLQTDAPEAAQTMGRISVDLDFFPMMGIEPVAGRLFSEDFGMDRIQWEYQKRQSQVMPIVLNKRAAASLGYVLPENAIGQQLQFTVSEADDRVAEIVGVIPDVHYKSLKDAIQPMIFYPDPGAFSVMMVRIDPEQREAAIQSIEEGWSAVMSNQAISSDFLAAALSEQYDAEAQELKTVTVLSALGILIAVFGQYGLAAYSAQSRRREISIRKVLGARVRDILQLFVWQFSKPVFVAMVVAWPIAFYVMTLWLENFVYRVAPNPLWFVLAGIIALTVALLTVSGHALKAARAAPVEALRYE